MKSERWQVKGLGGTAILAVFSRAGSPCYGESPMQCSSQKTHYCFLVIHIESDILAYLEPS